MFIFATPELTATVEISNIKIKSYYGKHYVPEEFQVEKIITFIIFGMFFLAYVIATKESTVCLVVLVKFLF